MFISESTSFHSIASFSFEFILIPEMLLEEGYLRLLSDLLLHLHICHFCHDYCVHDMPMTSTYVLLRVLPSFQRCNPCIFVMCVVTCASLQNGALDNSVFRDLVISLSPGIVYLTMPYVLVVS